MQLQTRTLQAAIRKKTRVQVIAIPSIHASIPVFATPHDQLSPWHTLHHPQRQRRPNETMRKHCTTRRVPDPRTAKPYSRAPNETSMVTKCSSVNLSTRPLGCSRPERTPAAPGRRRSSPQRCPGSTATPRRRHNSTWSRPLVFEWPTWRGFSRRRRRLGGVWEGLPATAVSPSDWTWLGELRADGGVADFFKTRAWESYQGAPGLVPRCRWAWAPPLRFTIIHAHAHWTARARFSGVHVTLWFRLAANAPIKVLPHLPPSGQ